MANDLYRFIITSGQVTAVLEAKDGLWRPKSIDATDLFVVGPDQVTWTELYPTHREVKVFALVAGDQYVETAEFYTQPDGSPLPPGMTVGDDSDNRMRGGGDDDTMIGGSGSDDIWGGLGDDRLHGGIGEDTIRGGHGADDVDGDDGDDRLFGDAGDDHMRGGRGRDDLNGGIGRDDLAGDDGRDTLRGGGDDDRLDGGADDDRLFGGDGRDYAIGGTGNDMVLGGGGGDTVRGGLGNDVIFGEVGDDRLFGESGRDIVEGGLGRDILAGGGGIDVFRFSSHGTANADWVLDFVHGTDRVAISGAAFGGLPAGSLDPAAFEANDAGVATGAATRLVYETDTGRLTYDADGAGPGGASLIAVFTNLAGLTASDISVF